MKTKITVSLVLGLASASASAQCILHAPAHWANAGKDELNISYCWTPGYIFEAEYFARILRKREALCKRRGFDEDALARRREAETFDINVTRCRKEFKVIEQQIDQRFPKDASEMKACLGSFAKTEPLPEADEKWLSCKGMSTIPPSMVEAVIQPK